MEPDEPEETETRDDVPDRLVEMLAQREFERIARALERDLDVSADDADDAVLEAVVRTLERDEPLERAKVGSYVLRVARNALVDLHRSRRRFDEAAPDLYDEHDGRTGPRSSRRGWRARSRASRRFPPTTSHRFPSVNLASHSPFPRSTSPSEPSSARSRGMSVRRWSTTQTGRCKRR